MRAGRFLCPSAFSAALFSGTVCLVYFPVSLQFQGAVRDDRRDDEPKSRERDQRIDDDGTDGSGSLKDRRYEVEIEDPEESPI